MRNRLMWSLIVMFVVAAPIIAMAADPFTTVVRPTKPLTPAEQLKTFHLPDGFEIQLVASAPEIQKPMNLAFDARGRLWVSGSVEYPIAAKVGQGRDAIRVLEDTTGDGRADKITTFADGLNIPIGLYPYRDGVVVYSIPNIYFLRDTDGDGKADKREVLYGPLGIPRDTHGMQNAFRRGFDGWLYVCHGFSNTSTIRGRDGSQITLQSGNTYRLRLDGSRVEQFTWGQVNPFGMAFAENGEMFNADCHSKPLSLLLRGGNYTSFGKPHDGLGFVKPVMSHSHGSTAIAGTAICTSNDFPAKYRGCLFVGNVMTGRIHRDSLVRHGSTVEAKEEADFLKCDDPWFRPVDVRFGPDGALYIADFYNRIIGHYEVPLTHPGRDRTRGRIWRVVYTGKKTVKPVDLHTAGIEPLIVALSDSNLTTRMLATDQLSDRIGKAAVKPLRSAIKNSTSPFAKIHAMWALHRLGALPTESVVSASCDKHSLIRVHAMKMLGESSVWNAAIREAVVARLADTDPIVTRAAAAALGRHSDAETVRPLLDTLHKVPEQDVHMRQVIRIALRNQLQVDATFQRVQAMELSNDDRDAIAAVSLAVRSEAAAGFLVDHLRRGNVEATAIPGFLSHAVRFLPRERIDALVKIAREKVPGRIDLQLAVMNSVQRSLQQRGLRESAAVRQWGASLAGQLLTSVADASKSWGSVGGQNPWGLEKRDCADGKKNVQFLSSLPGGEQLTGRVRSEPFAIPKRLQFYICGHLGFPKDPPTANNFAQLRLAGSGKIIAKRLAPRSDLAQLVDWDLAKYAKQMAYLEVVDGMAINAYAWVAVSRFDPPVMTVPQLSPRQTAVRQVAAADIARRLQLRNLTGTLRSLIRADHADWTARAAAGRALVAFRPNPALGALAAVIAEPVVSRQHRTAACRLIAEPNSAAVTELLSQLMRTAPTRIQTQLTHQLTEAKAGGEILLSLVEKGHASARLLRDTVVRQKLLAAKPKNVVARINALTALLPDIKAETQLLIATRLKDFRKASPSANRGRRLFAKTCAVCHQVHGQGAVVGPQLDGIGNRGLERVMEDVLDPNRNVDANFHTTVYALESGKVVVGLFRRREGKTLVLADRNGKEVVIVESEIEDQKKSKTSIMPENVASQLKPDEFYDLVAYLLTLRKSPPTPVAWKVTQLDQKFCSEGVTVADVNRDGKADVLAGEFWYEAPDWKRHEITTPKDYGDGSRGYSTCFACFADDFNADGWPDYLVVGFPGAPCHWYENPKGKTGHWKKHTVWHSACNETPLYADLFGTGKRVLVMGWQKGGTQNAGQMAWFAPGKDPTKTWVMHPISRPGVAGKPIPGTNRFSHGLGVGDINKDGREDVVCTAGWWEQPQKLNDAPWKFHPAKLGPGCANMIVTDVNGDGTPDVISSAAHQFGIWWHRQDRVKDGDPKFTRNDLFPDLVSQTHALQAVDVDGDGVMDLITGKRWWAHGPKGDPGSDQLAMLYWFQAVRQTNGQLRYFPRVIHRDSGVGTQFFVGNINADKLPDIAVSNKRGVFIYEQIRRVVKPKK